MERILTVKITHIFSIVNNGERKLHVRFFRKVYTKLKIQSVAYAGISLCPR